MDIEPRIETLIGKKLVGKRKQISFANNKAKELWQDFMPRRKEVTNTVGTELFSVEVYTLLYSSKTLTQLRSLKNGRPSK